MKGRWWWIANIALWDGFGDVGARSGGVFNYYFFMHVVHVTCFRRAVALVDYNIQYFISFLVFGFTVCTRDLCVVRTRYRVLGDCVIVRCWKESEVQYCTLTVHSTLYRYTQQITVQFFCPWSQHTVPVILQTVQYCTALASLIWLEKSRDSEQKTRNIVSLSFSNPKWRTTEERGNNERNVVRYNSVSAPSPENYILSRIWLQIQKNSEKKKEFRHFY